MGVSGIDERRIRAAEKIFVKTIADETIRVEFERTDVRYMVQVGTLQDRIIDCRLIMIKVLVAEYQLLKNVSTGLKRPKNKRSGQEFRN